MEGQDVVFLAGAYYPRYSTDLRASLEEGVRGVRNACAAALEARVPRLVYTSTIATLARAPAGRIADERDVPKAVPEGSVYRAVKWAMEEEVRAARARGLDAITLMPGGCVGPWDVRLGTGSVLVGAVSGRLPWWVEGEVNLVDVGDVARAHVAAARSAPHDRYCLGGHDVQVGVLLERIVRRYGGRLPALRLTPEEARAQADADERAAAPTRARVPVPRELVDLATTGQPVSCARAERDLGFVLSPLDRALDRAHEWFVRHRYLPSPERRVTAP
jgi:dihydroflavonol-4-reductase